MQVSEGRARLTHSENPARTVAAFERKHDLGEGVYGSVFVGRDKGGGVKAQDVAVKHLRNEPKEDEEHRRHRIHVRDREIRTLSRLGKHPNIVYMYEVLGDEADDSLYLVLELGQVDFRILLRDNPHITAYWGRAVVKGFIWQIAQGMHHCHARGVIHRDIKPENIIYFADGHIKLTDFGLARNNDPQQYGRYTNNVFTQWYRAPELLLGARHYDFSVDVWAFGCVVGELITNHPLFPAADTNVKEQLDLTWHLAGTPLENGWPEAAKLPLWKDLRPMTLCMRDFRRVLKVESRSARVEWWSDAALDFLNCLLTLRPQDRPKSAQILQHPYLIEESPAPLPPDGIPVIPEKRIKRQKH